jgi:hypothetical protein
MELCNDSPAVCVLFLLLGNILSHYTVIKNKVHVQTFYCRLVLVQVLNINSLS